MQTFNVHVSYDRANAVWVVDESDIPGLNVEAPSYDALIEIVRDAAPDLIDAGLGRSERDGGVIPLAFQHRTEAPRARSA